MSARTPGPWVVDFDHPRRILSKADHAFLADCDGIADEACDEANAAFIVTACNSHDALVAALEDCIYEIDSNKHYAGAIALEPSSNTKRILAKARAALEAVQS